MKILILNGYSRSVQGDKSFQLYQALLQELFAGMKEMIDTEIEFFIRDRDSIVEFLFEADSAYIKIEAGKYFDQIDMIFFEGDANMRPWSPNAMNLLLFLRMCLRGNKILFASSFAMQSLVFLIASNNERHVNIVNGVNGGQLGDLSKLSKDIRDIRMTDCFLDHVTGDLYGFSYETGEWAAKGNAGIHYRRAAEEFKTIGKYIIKAPQYKSSHMKEIEQLYVSKSNETICSMRKNNMHHYLFQQIPFEFMVPFKNSWDVHPFNFVNPKKSFVTLADCLKGPMVIEVTNNIVGTQFGIDSKYPETIIILRNFLSYQLQKLCSNKSNTIAIDLASLQINENALDLMLEAQSRSKYSEHKTSHKSQNIKFNVITEFHHAGYASRKQGNTLQLVLNNAIGTKVMKQKESEVKNPFLQEYYNTNITTNTFSSESQKQQYLNLQKGRQTNSSYKNSSQAESQHSIGMRQQCTQQDESKDDFNKTRSEIRLLLHPDIDKACIPKVKPLWIPGQLSMQKPSEQTNTTIKLLQNQTGGTYLNKFHRHRQVIGSLDSGRAKPVIRNSSPYITEEQMRKQLEKEEDKKIIGHKKFICNVPQPQFIGNYVTRTPSNPANQHQYRTEKKTMWVSQNNFMLC